MTTKLEELERDIAHLGQHSDEQVDAEEAAANKLTEVSSPSCAPPPDMGSCCRHSLEQIQGCARGCLDVPAKAALALPRIVQYLIAVALFESH